MEKEFEFNELDAWEFAIDLHQSIPEEHRLEVAVLIAWYQTRILKCLSDDIRLLESKSVHNILEVLGEAEEKASFIVKRRCPELTARLGANTPRAMWFDAPT